MFFCQKHPCQKEISKPRNYHDHIFYSKLANGVTSENCVSPKKNSLKPIKLDYFVPYQDEKAKCKRTFLFLHHSAGVRMHSTVSKSASLGTTAKNKIISHYFVSFELYIYFAVTEKSVVPVFSVERSPQSNKPLFFPSLRTKPHF